MRSSLTAVLRTTLVLAVVLAGHVALAGADPRHASERGPLVIGHRGASGYLPEHTLEGYALAIALGADFVEPDLVATKDGHLIARHEPNLVATTDVKDRPEFAARFRTVMLDGVPTEGWFASDFTLAEIKRLRAVQAFPERPQQFNGRFEIPTLEEIIALVKYRSRQTGRTIGIYPETKHPTYHRTIGLPLEARLVRVLKAVGWDRRDSPVFIQSFEPGSLRLLRTLTRNRLVQLIDANDVNADGTLDYTAPFDRPFDWTASGDPTLLGRTFAFMVTDEGLREIRAYADGIGPWKPYIRSSRRADVNGDGTVGDEDGDGAVTDSDRALLPPTDLVQRAHRLGLVVHPYTFRNERFRLVSDYDENPVNEYLTFYRLGVDGLFSDFADTAFAARVLFELERDRGFARCLAGDDVLGCD